MLRRALVALAFLSGLVPALATAAVITTSGPCPANPGRSGIPVNAGDLCFRTDTGAFHLWDGTAWRTLLTVDSSGNVSQSLSSATITTLTAPTITATTLTPTASTLTLSSGQLLLPNGTTTAPAMAWASEPGYGWFRTGSNAMYLGLGGVAVLGNVAAETRLRSTQTFGWSSSTSAAGAPGDTLLSRAAAGQLTLTAVAFASLGTPADGTWTYCNNCLPASDPCTGASTGAWAFRQSGAWKCL